MSDDELKGLFDEMRQENLAAHAETWQYIEILRRENSAAHQETRTRVDNLAGVTRDLRSEFDLMFLRFETVAQTVERLDDIERTTAETHDLVKTWHSSLDRRVRSLEER